MPQSHSGRNGEGVPPTLTGVEYWPCTLSPYSLSIVYQNEVEMMRFTTGRHVTLFRTWLHVKFISAWNDWYTSKRKSYFPANL